MGKKTTDNYSIDGVINELSIRWGEDMSKLVDVLEKIETLENVRNMLLTEINEIIRILQEAKVNGLDIEIPNLVIPLKFRFSITPNLTIGDAMEMLLLEEGSLHQKEIISKLKEYGFELNSKNPHIIIANAIKKDSRERFRRLNDGRVSLTHKK